MMYGYMHETDFIDKEDLLDLKQTKKKSCLIGWKRWSAMMICQMMMFGEVKKEPAR